MRLCIEQRMAGLPPVGSWIWASAARLQPVSPEEQEVRRALLRKKAERSAMKSMTKSIIKSVLKSFAKEDIKSITKEEEEVRPV